MCGIAGMIGLTAGPDIQKKILATMVRRGPDGNGVFQEGNCTLLHSRLAIIDPAGGAQPMTAAGHTIIYNGELYNTEELRRELTKLGHQFRTRCDTEVALHGFLQWGEECLGRFNGIFAFAVWDGRRLFLARDRIGVKPLFYKEHGGGLIFGSEIKNILAYPGVRAEIDEDGAAELLLLGPGRTPGCGVYRGICEIEPGCCGWYEDGKLSLRRYWKLRDREHRESLEETAEHVRSLVLDAVRRQMVSDVPIGTFLSGGLDSSIITAICADYRDQLPTFSVDYEGNDRYFRPTKFQPNSDGEFIRLMQKDFSTDHHWTVLTPEDLVDVLEDATRARDLPGMADVDFSLLCFCRDVSRHVKVALSGECADEIFGGYPWYRDPSIRDADGFPWSQNIEDRAAMLNPAIKRGSEYVRERYLQTCRESDILPGTDLTERRMKEMVNLNFRWFMQTLLDRKDRMSMYSGLEVRVPFCDWRIAEYLYAVPWAYKDHQGREKGLLRYAMAGLLPKEILLRRKSPYPKTWDPKYTELVSTRLRKLLEEKDAPIFHLVRREALEGLLTRNSAQPWYGQLMTGPQTIAYMLQVDICLKNGVNFTF
ncbi:MAG: asparagine synthase (glutamine-hydrolyzing) [Oscillospiraceae bacterium]|nr:asparagine synthase (glutamine-hydrolyzing) [Oscillospiraceae bacterium]